MEQIHTSLNSEVGALEAVILHRPGIEIERMTPTTIKEALYSDLLSESIAKKEYLQLEGVLSKYTKVLYIDDLLGELLATNAEAKEFLIDTVCRVEKIEELRVLFTQASSSDLTKWLIEGLSKDEVKDIYRTNEDYLLTPLYNIYFTRDIGVSFNGKSMPTQMATRVRRRENIITDVIFRYHPIFTQIDAHSYPWDKAPKNAILEGGDFLVAAENIFLIGMGGRSNQAGVDAFIAEKAKYTSLFYVVTQELPTFPESFIHLDMVFTLLDRDVCMLYAPLILEGRKYKTTLLKVENGVVTSRVESNLLTALQRLNMPMNPICCGGSNRVYMDRDQWHSGANFFTIAPGHIMGYERNTHTIDALHQAGFKVISANEIIASKENLLTPGQKTVITLKSSELVRGGGGCRCMTMPIQRKSI
ncbi:MAG: arginine deiminase family protein [Bacteroidales bacterium]